MVLRSPCDESRCFSGLNFKFCLMGVMQQYSVVICAKKECSSLKQLPVLFCVLLCAIYGINLFFSFLHKLVGPPCTTVDTKTRLIAMSAAVHSAKTINGMFRRSCFVFQLRGQTPPSPRCVYLVRHVCCDGGLKMTLPLCFPIRELLHFVFPKLT